MHLEMSFPKLLDCSLERQGSWRRSTKAEPGESLGVDASGRASNNSAFENLRVDIKSSASTKELRDGKALTWVKSTNTSTHV